MQSYPPPPPPAYGGQPGYFTAQQVRYGGFWIRFLARLIDGLIIGIPLGVVYGIVAAASGLLTPSSDGQLSPTVIPALSLIWAFGLVLTIGYFVVMWSLGATVGMRLLKLRVVDAETGQNISYGKAFLRYLGQIVSGIACYIGYIWAAFDSRKQGWHDKIAGTVVLQG